ncbi:MAG: hypothetical protein H0V86_11390 [Chloroflexia bacterium]|nr:hypothetical protein [Chloroflexia bacterium]
MLDNNSYNIITALHNKSEALTTYDKYIQDAQDAGSQECVQIFQQFQQQDEQAVEQLKQHVQLLVNNGKF